MSVILISHELAWVGQDFIQIHKAYRKQLARYIADGRKEVCPSRDAHRREFYYQGGVFYCGACQRLNKAIA